MNQTNTLSPVSDIAAKRCNKTFLFNPEKIEILNEILGDAIDQYTLTQYYFPYTSVNIENGTLSIAAKNENPHHIKIQPAICSLALDIEKEREEKISYLVKMNVLSDPLSNEIDVSWGLTGERNNEDGSVQKIELSWEGSQNDLKFTTWKDVPKIKKVRYILSEDNQVFEIDVFKDKNNGLVLIKAKNIDESFVPPSWFGEDVSDSKNYSNYRLSLT